MKWLAESFFCPAIGLHGWMESFLKISVKICDLDGFQGGTDWQVSHLLRAPLAFIGALYRNAHFSGLTRFNDRRAIIAKCRNSLYKLRQHAFD